MFGGPGMMSGVMAPSPRIEVFARVHAEQGSLATLSASAVSTAGNTIQLGSSCFTFDGVLTIGQGQATVFDRVAKTQVSNALATGVR